MAEATSAPDDPSDKDWCEELLENISEGIGELVTNFSDKGDSAVSVCEAGANLIERVKGAVAEIGMKDLRNPLLEEIHSFHTTAQTFDLNNNGSRSQFALRTITKNLNKLAVLLNKPWNADISGANKIVGSNEESIDNKYIFKLATPLKKKPKFNCEDCSKTFSNYKVFKSHLKSKHDKNPSFDAPKVTCLLPHNQRGTRVIDKHPMDQISSHLLKVHNIEKPSKMHQFRGHESFDGGKTWSPSFRLNNEPDPCDLDHGSIGPGPSTSKAEGEKGEPEKQKQSTILHFFQKTGNSSNAKKTEKDPDEFGNDMDETIGESKPEDDNRNLTIPQQHGMEIATLDKAEEMEVSVEDNVDSIKMVTEEEKIDSEKPKDFKDVYIEHEDEHNVDDGTCNRKHSNDVELKLPCGLSMEPAETPVSATASASAPKGSPPPPASSPTPAPTIAAWPSALSPTPSSPALASSSAAPDDEHLKNVEDESAFNLHLEEDSDVEDEDSEEYTQRRLLNKRNRYQKRRNTSFDGNPADDASNKLFIEDFVQHVVRNSSTMNNNSSTVSLSTSLLFRHDDSFLVYTKKRNPTFSLSNLICFQDEENFIELKDPSSWIDDISGEDGRRNPIRRKEMYKAYKRLCSFVLKELGNADFGTDLMSLLRRDKIKNNLKDIGEEINQSKRWSNLQKIIDQDHREVQKAKDIVKPNERFNEEKANQTYFASETFKERVRKNEKIWENAVTTNKAPGAKDFDALGNFARHLLTMTDRNRSSGYHFRNSHYSSRKEVWFPPGHNKEGKFDGIPNNWDMFSQPPDGREADAWTMDLSGSEEVLKLSEDVNIIILPLANEWLQKYRDVKEIKWNNTDPEEYFFVNNKRKRFSPMNNTAMLKEYAEITNTAVPTTNTFRKAMEPKIQSEEALKVRSKDIASHSSDTGSKFYDRSAPQFRCSAMQFINQDCEEVDEAGGSSVPDNVSAKRQKLDEDGKKARMQKAKNKLMKDPAKRNVTLGKNCKVKPADRQFMQVAFSRDGCFDGHKFFNGKFPGEAKFKQSFYRLIDGGGDEDENIKKLRTIEETVFSVVRASEDFGPSYNGSLEDQKKADVLVASSIRNSFRVYEKNRKGKEDSNISYFMF